MANTAKAGNPTLVEMIKNGATEEEMSRYLSTGVIPESYEARYKPQNYTFWNGGRTNEGFKIDSSNAATWQRIASLYDSGDVNGAMELVNGLSGKGTFGGYYDDNGQYWGFAQGYKGGANASFQPVLGGRIMTTGLDTTGTNVWLTPDGKALQMDTGGVLTDKGDTWSRTRKTDIAEYSRQMRENAAQVQAKANSVSGGLNNTGPGGNGSLQNDARRQDLPIQEGPTLWQEYLAQVDGAEAPKWTGGTYDPETDRLWQEYLAKYDGAEAPKWTGGTYDPETDVLWQEYLARYDGAEAPKWTGGTYDPETDSLWQEYLARYEGAEAPVWQGSAYEGRRDEAMERASAPFSYDPETDPVYASYRKAYAREGQRATEDTLGRYASMTGGMPSTAAVTAARQAGGYYAAQLADKLPELYQQAYQRYLQEYQRQLGIAAAYDAYGQEEYDRYRGELGQWNADRSFAYGAARDSQAAGRQRNETEYSRYLDAADRYDRDRSFAYTLARDAVSDQRIDREWAQKLREYADAQNWKAEEWQQYLREYGDKLSRQEQEWAYQQMRDAVDDARYADTLRYDRAQDALDRQRQDARDEQSAADAAYTQALNEAKLAAQYGDYSGLEAMGISPNADNLRTLAIAEAGRIAPVGSGNGRSGGSGSGGGAEETYSTSTLNAAYRAYLNGDRSDLTLRILRSAGLTEPEGSGVFSDAGDPGSEYAVMDRVLADMQAQGRPWNQLQTELDAELRDERITREEYEALRQKYVSRGLEDGVGNLEGVVHRDGSPMSAGFTGVWRTVRDLADRQEKEKALAAMRRAYDAGTIHEYEIDVMMDQLGW